jgi:hypothetical protein
VKPYLAAVFAVCISQAMALEPRPAVHEEYNASLHASMPLEDGWENPPRIARTRVWWWWLNGNTDKSTITRDLEAMKAVGMGGANVIDAGGDTQEGNRRVPHGPDFGSPQWIELFRHAIAEADRLGLEMGFNIQSGWNLGGPNVPAEDSSKRVTFSSTIVEGGRMVDVTLPKPQSHGGYFADVAVLAVPAAQAPAGKLAQTQASSAQTDHAAALASDGNPDSFWVSGGDEPGQGPSAQKPEWLELEFREPVTADHIEIHPRPGYGPAAGHVEAVSGNQRKKLASFTGDGNQPVSIKFPNTRMERLRIVITASKDPRFDKARNVQLTEIVVAQGDRLVLGPAPSASGAQNLAQKAYFQYPGDFTATKAWHLLDHGPAKPGEVVVPPPQIMDVSRHMDADGRLRWQAPAGQWEILRFGSTLSGAHVSTHSENAGGHAIDYLDRTTLDAYWSKTLDPILQAVKPYLGKSLRFLHTDSWELGPVNWTRRMPEEFQRLRGYDIKPWLPALAGKIVGSREMTDRFLNDFRRTLADLMAENKYRGFSEKAQALGLGIHPESGGPHAGPMDALLNLGISDVPMGEFWSTSPRHRVRDDQRFFVKQTTSAAHVYGRRVSLAEAFTNIGRHWQHDPRSLKATFDRAACEGHNLTMWHTFPSSKPEHGIPGAAYFAGEHLNPNVTWWEQGRAFIEYMNRCHFMLQQGISTSDVLHFYGENVPSFVRLKRDDPAQCLPGYDYDVINSHALLHRVRADENGQLVLPEGTSYRILSLTPHDAVSLPVLRHIAAMVEAGVTLVGPRPQRPFSLSGGQAAEEEFRQLTQKLWGDGPQGENRVGNGRVIWGRTTREVLQADGVPEDFSWDGGDKDTFIDFIQRRTDDTRFYFIANRNERPENLILRFRVTGMVPEIWDPVTGSRRQASLFQIRDGVTELPYTFAPEEAFFVVFRKPATDGAGQGTSNTQTFHELAGIDGPWEVSFDPKWGGPAAIRFEKLIDWTSHPDDGIRHYSGSAVYRKTFQAPAASGSVFLDLGMVESLCEVTLNGKDLGIWWSFPFRREITAHLKPGTNTLEVKVVNLWCNRIIGDAALPESQRRTRTNITRLTKDTPLEPSGLLGPVRLLRGE